MHNRSFAQGLIKLVTLSVYPEASSTSTPPGAHKRIIHANEAARAAMIQRRGRTPTYAAPLPRSDRSVSRCRRRSGPCLDSTQAQRTHAASVIIMTLTPSQRTTTRLRTRHRFQRDPFTLPGLQNNRAVPKMHGKARLHLGMLHGRRIPRDYPNRQRPTIRKRILILVHIPQHTPCNIGPVLPSWKWQCRKRG